MSRSNSQTRKIIAVWAGVIGLLLLQPLLWGWAAAVAADVRSQQSQGQQLTNTQQRIADMKASLVEQASLLDQLIVPFPLRTDTPQIVERLEQLAQATGVQVTIHSIAESADEKKQEVLIPLRVNLTATGTTAALLEYIDRVEHTQELVHATAWSLRSGSPNRAPAQGSAPSGSHQVTMELIFYLQEAIPSHGTSTQ